MRRVLIGTPCYDGRTEVWYNFSMNETIKLACRLGIELDVVYMSYDALIQRARNDLMALAVSGEYDDLIFIDSDQQWDPYWVFRLLNHNVDVVGGAVVKKSDAQEAYNVRSAGLPITDRATGLLLVEGLGTGFLRLSKAACLSLWESSQEYINEGRVCRMVFDVQIVNGYLVSEDNVVCTKLINKGHAIYLDREMTCAHVGHKKWEGNFSAFLSKLENQ